MAALSKKKAEPVIRNRLRVEMTSNVSIGEMDYLVVTENTGRDEVIISVKVQYKGDIIYTLADEQGAKVDPLNIAEIEPVVRKYHFDTVDQITKGTLKENQQEPDYLEQAKEFLRKKSTRKALAVLQRAYDHTPDDPFILTYYGVLSAVVDRRYKKGIDSCKKAIEMLKIKVPYGRAVHYPTFYLNLSRAYSAAGQKKKAVDTLYAGVRYDKEGGILHNELVKLGIRRKPPIPFLKRSNPLNKYIGIILYK